jgi:hypothetical protein
VADLSGMSCSGSGIAIVGLTSGMEIETIVKTRSNMISILCATTKTIDVRNGDSANSASASHFEKPKRPQGNLLDEMTGA